MTAAVILVFGACSSEPGAQPGDDGDSSPTGQVDGPWLLISGNFDGEPITMVAGYPITMTIEQGTVSGTAACNGYGGEVTVDGSTIGFGGLGVTEMACGDFDEGGIMESESQFIQALIRSETFDVENESLTLTGDDIELVFQLQEPVPTSELTGTVWELDGLITGDAVSSVMGNRATLELFTDGSLIGSTGCRTLTGNYKIVGTSVEFTEFSAEGTCPPGIEEQDNQVVTVLGDGFVVEIEGDRMTITSQGNEGLTYKAGP